jgi:aspartyl protease family protein
MEATMRNLVALAAGLWLTLAMQAPAAQATDVKLIGLAQGTAVVIIDNGRPRTLRDGDTAPGDVKLLNATGDFAIFDIQGERRRLVLGEAISTNAPAASLVSLTLVSDTRGHFMATGSVNGASMRFLVDTGASMVSMGLSDARRAGINYLEGERAFAQTANGVIPVYRVRLDSVRVGDITLTGIDGLVHTEADLPVVLLGMSFLRRLDMLREGDNLTLIRRY